MKQIILIRHPETISSLDKKNNQYKILDPQISPYGLKQLEEIKGFLKTYDYEAIFTSLLRRSRDAARLINSRNRPLFNHNAFNEYHLDPEGKGAETVEMAIVRTMTRIYSMFDQYESIIIVGHSSINKTIMQTILNCEFDEAGKYFNKLGEVQVLRYDWKIDDKVWKIIDSFIPSQ